MGHIKGIGGIFFKSQNIEKLKKWYRENLEFNTDEYGATFKIRDHDNPDKEGYVVWGPFKAGTEYFGPSKKEYMVNFRVDDLNALLRELEAKGIKQVGERQEYDFGSFAWIMDPDGTKIEFWQPKGPIPE